MKLEKVQKFLNDSKVSAFFKKVLNTWIFPVACAVVSIASYYLGLDILNMLFLCVCGAAIMLFCADITPILCIVLFINICVSRAHTPLTNWLPTFGGSDYFSHAAVLAPIIVGVVIFAATIIYRLVQSVVLHKFKPSPMFWGLCALGLALMLGGSFYNGYYFLSLLYGLALAACLVLLFVLVSSNITRDKANFSKISYYLIALFSVITVELIITYITDVKISEGSIDRYTIGFGWGTYNQFGMLCTICVPSWFYLALQNKKWGWAYLLGGAFNVVIALLCMSRQAIIMSILLLLICCVWYLLRSQKKERIIGGSMMGAALFVLLIVVIVCRDKVYSLFASLMNGLETGSSRTILWKEGFTNFLHYPIFGKGWYDSLAKINSNGYKEVGYFGNAVTASIPRMCHNTIIQILSSCGAVGFFAYFVHRAQTVISMFKNVQDGRLLIALSGCGILLTSFLDNHIFDILPTLIYAILLAFFSATEEKVPPLNNVNTSDNENAAESENAEEEAPVESA